MAFQACVPTQAKADFLSGVHAVADTYKCALVVQANATAMGAAATVFTVGTGTNGEIVNGSNGTAGYTAGGVVVARQADVVSGTKGVAGFANPTFAGLTTPTGGADGYVIYNTSKSNKIVYIGSLATPLACTNATGTITMPTQDQTTGLIRLN